MVHNAGLVAMEFAGIFQWRFASAGMKSWHDDYWGKRCIMIDDGKDVALWLWDPGRWHREFWALIAFAMIPSWTLFYSD